MLHLHSVVGARDQEALRFDLLRLAGPSNVEAAIGWRAAQNFTPKKTWVGHHKEDALRKSLEAGLTRLENILMFSALMGALTIGVIQVILRYVFRTGLVWSELAIVTLTILAAFVGGSRAAAKGAHVRVTLFAQWLGFDARRYLEVIAVLVSIAYCLFTGYASLLFISFLQETGAVAPEADVPLWVIYAIAPLAMTLFTISFIQRIPKAWSGVWSEKPETID